MNLHHKRISRFEIEGTLYDEAHVDRLKREYLALLVLQMKADGYVVRADIDIDWTMTYISPREGFHFKLSVYGIHVGKRKAQEVDRVYGYKPQYAKRPVRSTTRDSAETT